MNRRSMIQAGAAVLAGGVAIVALKGRAAARPDTTRYPVSLTPEQWRRKLTPAAFDILREEGTEAPYSSPLLNEHRRGVFACAGCALPAYESKTKYDSGTGWPSFWAPLPHGVATRRDDSLGMARTEVHCPRCGGHLGHVFDDGPAPTGLRYCMNGAGLVFQAA